MRFWASQEGTARDAKKWKRYFAREMGYDPEAILFLSGDHPFSPVPRTKADAALHVERAAWMRNCLHDPVIHMHGLVGGAWLYLFRNKDDAFAFKMRWL